MSTKSPSKPSGRDPDKKIAGLKRHASERQRESLERIRQAASAVFGRRGYTSVTMDELAREAGVTRQTLYRHFPSKYGLALETIGNRDAGFEPWRKLGGECLKDRALVLSWVQSVIAHQVNLPWRRAYGELASTELAFRQVLAKQIAQIVGILADAHPFFAAAAADPDGFAAAKAHLFVATLIERSDFIAIGEEWIGAEHLEQIMTDWLLALVDPASAETSDTPA